ncbi:hypothetical protein J437_LFUL008943 [Ladona fulva]|uniref:Uncharacterized protein n=1 Tax=Ladona fulva TaxID=123851 RepID=A0A8K0P2A2_LADFU|nr:hypothetical protein J437_LFUL008943 [Ladona fulva]
MHVKRTEKQDYWKIITIGSWQAALTATAEQVKDLFAILSKTYSPSNSNRLWETIKESMGDDVLYQVRQVHPKLNIELNEEIFNQVLIRSEEKCFALLHFIAQNKPLLIENQKQAYDFVIRRSGELRYWWSNLFGCTRGIHQKGDCACIGIIWNCNNINSKKKNCSFCFKIAITCYVTKISSF